nr:MogA/MoaB family molybdenum cofactor biosynthesis protein [Candidatus Njordarchaeum guaymaensis]
MSYLEHKKKVPTKIKFALLVVSDSRYKQHEEHREVDDESSLVAKRILEENGHEISTREIVPDEGAKILGSVLKLIEGTDCDAILTVGGTGLSKRDVTIESVRQLIEKEVIGFGEIFRNLSYLKIGTPAILSRALAGIIRNKVIFCLPGSPQSVELSLRNLIIPEIGHMLRHVRE